MLADQYYLIAHEDRTGRSRLHPRATGLGLAAALLSELVLEGRVGVADGELFIVDRHPPRDALSHDVLDLLSAQSQHTDVRTWLAFLSQDAALRVAERLMRVGAVEMVTRRRMLGSTQTLYMPNTARQRNAAAWASTRIANILVRGMDLNLADRLLVGLVVATGLTRHVMYGFEMYPHIYHSLPSMIASLPSDLRELVECTEQQVGTALAVGRR
ncbi:GPP34 family phosphoprotein [Actinoplanes sp. DH11]|uniref:GOLPH3/VPS74 family protein n=1 Tax=Actinoplanes sp. DH11 TaxID=2857011 RepID=UPI001E339AFD|nr:GPP34 family phosphoprotein [Actinoplanes sp. DH11]